MAELSVTDTRLVSYSWLSAESGCEIVVGFVWESELARKDS